MENPILKLNKVFDNRVRLGIMSVLMVNDWVEFNRFKEILGLTDGNLASHMNALEKEAFIEIRKEFKGKKPSTSYNATVLGRKSFQDHLSALENLIKNSN